MIIGNGDIAKALSEIDRSDMTFFASGVSNSKEVREFAYKREKKLLLDQDMDTHLVYFSSLCVFYLNTRYAQHKRYMEWLVKNLHRKYTIVRLGNIDWGTNPHTIINYIKSKKKEQIKVQDTYRYVIGKDEFIHWMRMIPDWNCEMNITGKRLSVKELVEQYGHA